MSENVRVFAIKAAISAALILFTVWVTAGILDSALTAQLDRAERIVRLEGLDYGAIDRVDKLIMRIGEADLSEERQKKILANIEYAANKWKPFFDKVKRVLEKADQRADIK